MMVLSLVFTVGLIFMMYVSYRVGKFVGSKKKVDIK